MQLESSLQEEQLSSVFSVCLGISGGSPESQQTHQLRIQMGRAKISYLFHVYTPGVIDCPSKESAEYIRLLCAYLHGCVCM